MMYKWKNILIIISFFLLIANCTLPYQLMHYTSYRFHDFIVNEDKMLIMMEMEEYSPRVSIGTTITGNVSSEKRYSYKSYYIVTIDIKSISNKYIKKHNYLFNNILSKNELSGWIDILLINPNLLYSSKDFVNNENYPSIINISKNNKSQIITKEDSSYLFIPSFDKSKILFTHSDRIFLFDTLTLNTNELFSHDSLISALDYFKNTQYLLNKGQIFIDQISENTPSVHYKYLFIDKKKNKIVNQFNSKYGFLKDLDEKNQLVLAWDPRYGLELTEITSNKRYMLDNSFVHSVRTARIYDKKVYIVTLFRDPRKKAGIPQILITLWDYKNDTIIRKLIPCDEVWQ